MKVFISWSGPLSKKLGEAFRKWLPRERSRARDARSPCRWASSGSLLRRGIAALNLSDRCRRAVPESPFLSTSRGKPS